MAVVGGRKQKPKNDLVRSNDHGAGRRGWGKLTCIRSPGLLSGVTFLSIASLEGVLQALVDDNERVGRVVNDVFVNRDAV